MNRLNAILLVDDDKPTNFLHKLVIEESQVTDTIYVKENGQEALDFLMSLNENKYPKPALILLDVNMPVMNGWEFIDKYALLDEKFKSEFIVVMLTTSQNPEDEKKADEIHHVSKFIHKPLTIEKLHSLLESHFQEEA